MRHRSLNHVALYVEDVARSESFYEDVLRLTRIERPAFDFPGVWYRLGEDQELHLISGQDQDPQVRSGANHFAILVDDMEEAERVLKERGGNPSRRRTRPDGALQIYLRDPDGHTIEICSEPETP